MVADDAACLGSQVEPELAQAWIQGVVERAREGWKVINARRERFPRTVQAPLLLVASRGRPGAAPGVVVCRTGGRASVFCDMSGSRPGFPVPLAGPSTRVTVVRMPETTGRRGPQSTGLSTKSGEPVEVVDNGDRIVAGGPRRPVLAYRRPVGTGAARPATAIARSTARSSRPTSSAASARARAAFTSIESIAAVGHDGDDGTDDDETSRRARLRALPSLHEDRRRA